MTNISAPAGKSTVEHHETRVDGLRLHSVHVPGHGPVMILLHGIGMDWRVWQALSRRLRSTFDLHILDLRGHGSSDKPRRGYSLGHYAADVEDFIDSMGLSNVRLVGSSLGGMVAVSVEAPGDVVSHRVLVDPPLTGGPVRDQAMFRDILKLKHQDVPLLADYLAASNPGSGRHYLRVMSEMWHEAADGVIEEMLACPNDYFNVDHALGLIDCPTLIVQADPARGGVLSDAQARRSLHLLPHGTLRFFAGAGHAVHAHAPREFTRLVVQFAGPGNGEARGLQ